ncbi:hypothetical protein PR202_gb18180 [Eleusine coracana subsp. coracana]|uniref:Kinesin motor domain-containing protein n=1 Tax=Eleusine coracana subsp. coracana TaxID=191504 RepID=A0AAV5F5G9_ELECO|nr:hypothetical protein PR202_gb18180 [Eleusine coracana subsp. coracana]
MSAPAPTVAADADAMPVKRGRGRPPKPKKPVVEELDVAALPGIANEVPAPTPVIVPLKRGRGRPPKPKDLLDAGDPHPDLEEKRAEVEAMNEELIEGLLTQLILSEILRNEELEKRAEKEAMYEERIEGLQTQLMLSEIVQKEEQEKRAEKEAMYEERIEGLQTQLMLSEIVQKEEQQLKGNIRVFCRVKPLNPGEKGFTISYPKSQPYSKRGISVRRDNKSIENLFTFDRVFDQLVSQSQIFEEISQLAQSAIDGHEVCIFTYGQTGSGKTFTMIGNENEDFEGIIPRSLRNVFESTENLISQGWIYIVQVAIMQIYDNQILDLLSEDNKSFKKDDIRQEQGTTSVKGLTYMDVRSAEDAIKLLREAIKKRKVRKTKMNETSSRSHLILTLHILGKNEEWWTKVAKSALSTVSKGINSYITLGAWVLWRHRNDFVFSGASPSLAIVLRTVGEEIKMWSKLAPETFRW